MRYVQLEQDELYKKGGRKNWWKMKLIKSGGRGLKRIEKVTGDDTHKDNGVADADASRPQAKRAKLDGVENSDEK